MGKVHRREVEALSFYPHTQKKWSELFHNTSPQTYLLTTYFVSYEYRKDSDYSATSETSSLFLTSALRRISSSAAFIISSNFSLVESTAA